MSDTHIHTYTYKHKHRRTDAQTHTHIPPQTCFRVVLLSVCECHTRVFALSKFCLYPTLSLLLARSLSRALSRLCLFPSRRCLFFCPSLFSPLNLSISLSSYLSICLSVCSIVLSLPTCLSVTHTPYPLKFTTFVQLQWAREVDG